MTVRELVQLPNKDLWRGHTREPVVEETEFSQIVAEEEQDPLNRAMAKVLASSQGAQTLTCVWCGYQSAEQPMRDHIRSSHKAVVEPVNAAAVALAATKTK